MNQLDPRLLELIRCPDCRAEFGPISAGPNSDLELRCTGCGLSYPVRNGVPILLVDEARRPTAG